MPAANSSIGKFRTAPLIRRHVLTGLASVVAASAGFPVFGQGKVVRIGTSLDTSGVEKPNGTGLLTGSLAYFAGVNRAGGLNGSKLELVVADDQFKPDLAKANALAFRRDASVLALLHPLGTLPCSEVIDAAPDMAVVGPSSGTLSLRNKKAPNAFWARVNYAQEIEKLVSNAVILNQTRIGLVHSDDPLGQEVLTAFNASLAKANLKPTVIATTPRTTSVEVGPAAQAIAQSNPQVVILALAGTAPAFLKAVRGASWNGAVYGLSTSVRALTQMGDQLARGVGIVTVVPSPSSTKYEIVRRYRADVIALGSKEFSLKGVEGYVDAALLVEGMRRAGSTLNRASIMAGMESIENFDLGGMKFNYSRSNREGSRFVDLAVIGDQGQIMS